MSYYQGDYYQGDYYQGDPFLGALFGMGVTWLGKKLLGRTAKAAGTTAIARVGGAAATGLAVGSVGTGLGALVASKGRDIFLNISSRGGGNMIPPNMPSMQMGAAPGGGGCCPTGYHLNKQISYGKNTMGMPAGSFCVKNRSLNPANPRALRRGLRRVVGFGKLAQRTKKSINAAARAVK